MATIESVFGPFAERMQTLIDEAADQFAPLWFPRFFTWGPQQTSLKYETVQGSAWLNPAASVVARGSRMPLRSRQGFSKVTGTIPVIGEKFKMDENDYREFLAMQNIPGIAEDTKIQQLIRLIFDDVRHVGDGAMKRIDYMCLEGVSTGQFTLTTTNNPDGTVQISAIDLELPAENKTNAAVNWGTVATATPIADIMKVVTDQRKNNRTFARILMTDVAWQKLIAADKTNEMYASYIGRTSPDGIFPTLDNINAFLRAQRLPAIEIVDETIGIEKDGVTTGQRPFEDDNIVFLPAGNIGIIHNAVAIEELRPVPGVQYAKFNNALISKFAENEPFGEYTKVELNAVPGFTNKDNIHILSTTAAF